MPTDQQRVVAVLEEPEEGRRRAQLLAIPPAALEQALTDIAVRHSNPSTRATALDHLAPAPRFLQDLALHDPAPEVRIAATQRLKAPEIVARVALQDPDDAASLAAVDVLGRLAALQQLVTVARTHRHLDVRSHARRTIKRASRAADDATIRQEGRRALWRARIPAPRIVATSLIGLLCQVAVMDLVATWTLIVFVPGAPANFSTVAGFLVAAVLGAGTILAGATPVTLGQLVSNVLKQTGGFTLALLAGLLVLAQTI